MILVPNVFPLQLLVQSRGAVFKSKVILLAAVEVDSQLAQARCVAFCQRENAVLIPVLQVYGLAERRAQQPAQRSVRLPGGAQLLRGLGDQRRALGADRRK